MKIIMIFDDDVQLLYPQHEQQQSIPIEMGGGVEEEKYVRLTM